MSNVIPDKVGATLLEEVLLLDDGTLLEVLLDELLEEVMLLVISEVLLVIAELVLLLDGVEFVMLLEPVSWHPTAIPMTTAPRSNVLMSFFIFPSFL